MTSSQSTIITEALFTELLQKQEALENHALAAGVHRFRRRVLEAQQAGQGGTVGAARKLMVHAIEPMERALTVMVQEKPKRGRPHVALKWVRLLGPDVVAYMTAKTVVDCMLLRVTVTATASHLVQLMLDEARYRRFQEQAPGLFRYRMEKFSTSNYAHMARSLNQAMTYAKVDVEDLDLPHQERLLIGVKLIDWFMDATGLCRVQTETSRKGRKILSCSTLVPTQETAEWIDSRNSSIEFHWPVNLPMVVPPLRWAATERGGYRFGMREKYAFMRRGGGASEDAPSMPVVYESVNRIQETPWRINRAVLDLVQGLVRRGGGLANIPDTDDAPLPARPSDIATNEGARKQWRRQAHAVKEANHRRQLRAKEFQATLSTALSVSDELAIWFPCNVDFRGRVYPLVNYLSPQGDDLSKALLTFAQGRPLGEGGDVWLATHGANCLGEYDGVKMSKLTLQERVDWIVAHTHEIEAAASDPFSNTWWATADDPLQFFAFCVEWAGYVALAREGRGAEYVCSLPCAMDGTCNGLQHFAAMLRDEQGAQVVNVTPNVRPGDVYNNICETVTSKLAELATGEDDVADLARRWFRSELLNRKLFKRPTMTFGYGSKKFGFRSQIMEFVQGHDRARELRDIFGVVGTEDGARGTVLPQASSALADLIWQALEAHVGGAFAGMAWLQTAARLVAGSGGLVRWTVPGTGFQVVQTYKLGTARRVTTMLAGKVFMPVSRTLTNKPNRVKQANAVAPNFVHSLDAAALMMTVQMAAAEGVECFGMVHDSYATLPADCAVLAQCTRQAFFALYQNHDVLEEFREQVLQQIPEKHHDKLPPVPAKGSLDLAGVLTSDYFFS